MAIPLLLTIAFNAMNLAYFWFVVLALSAAPRHGVQYSAQGGSAIEFSSAPPDTTLVSNVVFNNLTRAISGATTSNVSVQVCSSSKGVDSGTHIAQCDTFGPGYSFPAPAADPEIPLFVLHRVDAAYTVTPIIPGGLFNVVLPANLTFHRQVSMRSLY